MRTILEKAPNSVKIERVKKPDELQDLNIEFLSLKIVDPQSKQTMMSINVPMGSANQVLQTIESICASVIKGNSINSIGTTSNDFNYIPLEPQLSAFAKYQSELATLGFQLTHLSDSKNEILFGLKNITSYRYDYNKETKGYDKKTNLLELKFAAPRTADTPPFTEVSDTKRIMEELLERDNEATKVNGVYFPNNRISQYLTRKKTEALLKYFESRGDIEGIVKTGAGTLHSLMREARSQTHQGFQYRLADSLGKLLEDEAKQRNLAIAPHITTASLAILENLSQIYSQHPELFKLPLDESDKVSTKNHHNNIALAIASIVISKRKRFETQSILETGSRAICFVEKDPQTHPESVTKVLHSFGVPEEHALIYSISDRKITDPQMDGLYCLSQIRTKPGLIYIWGHGSRERSTVIDINKIIETCISASREVDGDVKLNHLTLMLDTCHSGTILEQIHNRLLSAGVSPGNIPTLISSGGRDEYSKGGEMSLFQESLSNYSNNKGLTGLEVLASTDSLRRYSTELAKQWKHSYNRDSEYTQRIMLGSQGPCIIDTSLTSTNEVIQEINKTLPSTNPVETKNSRMLMLQDDSRFHFHL